MYGPSGLAAIVSTASLRQRPRRPSRSRSRSTKPKAVLPLLADAAGLFSHWRDTTNAERMNYWLSVLSENAMLITRQRDGCSAIPADGSSRSP